MGPTEGIEYDGGFLTLHERDFESQWGRRKGSSMTPSNDPVVAASSSTATEAPGSDAPELEAVGDAASRSAPVIQPARGQHPWLRFGKLYSRDDPQIREWLDIIEERRRQADVELQRELEAE